MRVLLVALLAACASCTGEAELPDLEPGGYRLSLTNRFYTSIGPVVSLDPDGTIAGHPANTRWECAGQLGQQETVSLTNALNRANILGRKDHPQNCSDHSIYEFAIQATSGEAEGLANEFTYEVCTDSIPSVTAVLQSLTAPLLRLDEEGQCNGCPEGFEMACYDHHWGASKFCNAQRVAECTSVTELAIEDCPRLSTQCLPEYGWVPAVSWNLITASLVRQHEATGTRWDLDLSADVDNRSAFSLSLSDVRSYLRFVDRSTGTEISLESATVGMSSDTVDSRTSAQGFFRLHLTVDAESLAAVATEIDVALRERPWVGLPFGPAIAIDIIDQ